MRCIALVSLAAAVALGCAPREGGMGGAVDTAAAMAGLDSTRTRYAALQMAGDAAGVAMDSGHGARLKDGRPLASCHRHAVVEVAGPDDVTLIDLGNEPGTLVNGARINKCKLHVGDQVQIGGTRLVLERADAGGAEAVAVPAVEPPRAAAPAANPGEACSAANPEAASWRTAPSRPGPASAMTSAFRRSGAAPESSDGTGMPWRSMKAASAPAPMRRWPPGVLCALRRRALIQLTTVGSETPRSRAASKVVAR